MSGHSPVSGLLIRKSISRFYPESYDLIQTLAGLLACPSFENLPILALVGQWHMCFKTTWSLQLRVQLRILTGFPLIRDSYLSRIPASVIKTILFHINQLSLIINHFIFCSILFRTRGKSRVYPTGDSPWLPQRFYILLQYGRISALCEDHL